MCSAVSFGTQAQARNVGIRMVVAKMPAQNLRGVAAGPRMRDAGSRGKDNGAQHSGTS